MRISGRHQAGSRTIHRRRGMGPPPGGTAANRGRRAGDQRQPATYDADYRVTTQPKSSPECRATAEPSRYKVRVDHYMKVPPRILSATYRSSYSGNQKGASVDLYA